MAGAGQVAWTGPVGAGRRAALAMLLSLLPVESALAAPPQVVNFEVAGDAISQPLGGLVGDAARGRALVADRRAGLCLLCHRGPFPEERFQGDLSTDLSGAGARWTPGQLRLRLVDARRLNPDSVMPAYHRTAGLQRVGAAWQAQPIFSAQQVEDAVAFLVTLK
jgi:sulfur-oxidizing protein SoxX